MVKTAEQIRQEIEQSIEDFTTNFYNKYGVKAIVLYNIKTDKIAPIPMEIVETITNRLIRETIGSTYNVRSKIRLKEVINYRHTMFYYLHNMGYTLMSIGRFFGFNHATVIHGVNKIKWFIEINDETTLETLIKLKNGFKETNGSDGSIQPADGGEPNS